MKQSFFASALVLGPEALRRSPALAPPDPEVDRWRKFVEGMGAWHLPENFGTPAYFAEQRRAQARAAILRERETQSMVLQSG